MGCRGSKSAVQETAPPVDLREGCVWERHKGFEEVYEVSEKLGEGAMGTVLLVRKRLEAGSVPLTTPKQRHQYAAKVLEFKGSTRLKELRHEIDVLRTVDHPNIVHLREAFWEDKRLVLVMEFCEGVMLSKVCGDLGEYSIAQVAKQLLQAVAYLHGRGIVHRDLKLDNVMALHRENHITIRSDDDDEDDDDIVVKLIDFGLSRMTKTKDEVIPIKAAGTLSTAAPEVVIGGSYEYPADIWSLGACVYRLVCDRDPFLIDHVDPDAAMMKRLENAQFLWQPADAWATISKKCREFIYCAMRAKAGPRFTADQGLKFVEEVWIPDLLSKKKKVTAAVTFDGFHGEPRLSEQSLKEDPELTAPTAMRRAKSSGAGWMSPLTGSIKRFASYSDLKRAALIVAAHHVDHRRTAKLRRIFLELDADNSGVVSADELRAALGDDVDDLFKKLDYDHSGVVHYHEFLAATIEDDIDLLDDEALRDAFDRLDDDDTGSISPANLKHILGESASDDLVKAMIKDGDYKHNGVIDFEEFLALMRGQESSSSSSEGPLNATNPPSSADDDIVARKDHESDHGPRTHPSEDTRGLPHQLLPTRSTTV